MAGFIEQRFPEGVSYGATGGPRFRTNIETRGGGGEKRTQEWSSPLWMYDVRKGVVSQQKYDELLAFYLAIAKGRLNGFRFKDPVDNNVVNQPLDVPGTPTLGLIKTYTFGGFSFKRRITKPIPGTLSVTHNSIPVTIVDAATGGITGGQFDTQFFDESTFDSDSAVVVCDFTGGNITWAAEPIPVPGDTVLATFSFDVPCRFGTDHLEVTFANFQAYQISVPILELRL